MPEYRITLCHSARKEIEHLDTAMVARVFPKIEALAKNPYPRGCLKIQGQQNLWRIRTGDDRIIRQKCR